MGHPVLALLVSAVGICWGKGHILSLGTRNSYSRYVTKEILLHRCVDTTGHNSRKPEMTQIFFNSRME
jgi:hypothetical protein